MGLGEGLGYRVCPPTCSTLLGEQSRSTGRIVVGVVGGGEGVGLVGVLVRGVGLEVAGVEVFFGCGGFAGLGLLCRALGLFGLLAPVWG